MAVSSTRRRTQFWNRKTEKETNGERGKVVSPIGAIYICFVRISGLHAVGLIDVIESPSHTTEMQQKPRLEDVLCA